MTLSKGNDDKNLPYRKTPSISAKPISTKPLIAFGVGLKTNPPSSIGRKLLKTSFPRIMEGIKTKTNKAKIIFVDFLIFVFFAI